MGSVARLSIIALACMSAGGLRAADKSGVKPQAISLPTGAGAGGESVPHPQLWEQRPTPREASA